MGGAEEITKEERLLRLALRVAAVIFTCETLVYLVPTFIGSAEGEWIQLPFVVNSIVKAAVVGGVCWVAGADVRRFAPVVPVVFIATGGWVLFGTIVGIWADPSVMAATHDVFGLEISIGTIVWAGVAFEGALTLLFFILYRRAQKARYQLSYLSPAGFQTLVALADVLVVGEDERITPEEVGQNVDGYLAGFGAQRKWLIKVAFIGLQFYPLLTLHPPLALMAAGERRRFLEKRFVTAVAQRRIGKLRRALVQAMIRLSQQMVFVGYYGDERTFEATGYVPFSKRPRYPELMKQVDSDRPRVSTVPHSELDSEIEADAVVIGSGAAGAIIAEKLAEAGREVLILERGSHVDPSDFSENEVEMLMKLYSDGALQLSRDFRFQVLQGMCVGGSTVINNAVCFEIPEPALARWNGELDASLDPNRLRQSFEAVTRRLRITEQPDVRLNPGAAAFVGGVEKLGLGNGRSGGEGFGIVKANIADCFGCGYCNIGCAFGKKLSVLDTVLPEAQAKFDQRFRIIADCRVGKLSTSDGVCESVECELSDGAERRKLRVRANTVVIAAGAVSSSWLLKASGIGGKQVGRNLAFNMGSPVTADFAEEIHSYDGLQISHFLERHQSGYVFETWFNPVVSQALTMPGWFEDHYRNMRRYTHLTAVGVLVGTDRNARIARALTGGPDIDYTPTEADMAKLIDGVKLACKIFLAAGAERVMPATFHFLEFSSEAEVERLDDYVRDASDINAGTGHPQGGNAISSDPDKGVVDPEFRVHGVRNLYVCDASVFPTSITVNPQMTVMALADYAAAPIAAGD